jgi:hypothetical protein
VAALSRLKSLVSFEADADDEYSLLDRAARENEAEVEEGEGDVDITDSSKHLDPTTSIMIDVGKKTARLTLTAEVRETQRVQVG